MAQHGQIWKLGTRPPNFVNFPNNMDSKHSPHEYASERVLYTIDRNKRLKIFKHLSFCSNVYSNGEYSGRKPPPPPPPHPRGGGEGGINKLSSKNSKNKAEISSCPKNKFLKKKGKKRKKGKKERKKGKRKGKENPFYLFYLILRKTPYFCPVFLEKRKKNNHKNRKKV